MIAPRFGAECRCHACVIAGVAGQRTIEVERGVWAHGRDLARLYAQIDRFKAAARTAGPKPMPTAVIPEAPEDAA